jgi:single-strand DNA-binding protein
MNNLNSVLLEGILVKDSVFQNAENKPFCSFSISSKRFYKKDGRFEQEISIFDVETEGKFAEIALNLGKKGRGCRITGRLKQKKWTDIDGKDNSNIIIKVEHLEFKPIEDIV